MYACVLQTALAMLLHLASAEIVKRSGLFDTKANKKVYTGDMIKRQRMQNVFSCTQRCLSEPLCASFNYDSSAKSHGFCELHKDGGRMELTNEPGWTCGHLLHKQQIVKPPAECKTWQTKDGGCCVFPFIYRGRPRESCVFDDQLWCSITDNFDVDKLGGVCQDFNFTFTSLGARGPEGPTNTSGYKGTTLQYKVTLERGIQIWQVPLNGTYVIEAWGASGGEGKHTNHPLLPPRAGGKGAYMKGSFNLTRGVLLKILVGQAGSKGDIGQGALPGGGGGGTFVILSSGIPLIIAGGGGGGGSPVDLYDVGDPGQITEYGSQHGGSNGTGGKIHEEGSPSSSFEAGAGGGLTGNGESGGVSRLVEGGESFENGGDGGKSPTGGNGGFGGGGGGMKYPGAGGGYSGGGVFMKKGVKTTAGGGGSLNRGANPVKKAGENEGHGRVTIILVDIA